MSDKKKGKGKQDNRKGSYSKIEKKTGRESRRKVLLEMLRRRQVGSIGEWIPIRNVKKKS